MASDRVKTMSKYSKIRGTMEQASRRNIRYVWIDTCCIDKRSSAELSEVINSMFQWYRNAAVCFTLLEDLMADADLEEGLQRCRWFTRGWTLQELIASNEVRFFDREWKDRGSKIALQDTISHITGIRKDVLLGTTRLGDVLAAEKMSWDASRQTTRQEDIAYSLLGIFEVSMALIYGEGPNAFTRLQEEIIRRTNDLSIFAWDSTALGTRYCGLLVTSPALFRDRDHLEGFLAASTSFTPEFTITNKGVRIAAELSVSSDAHTAASSPSVDRDGYFLSLRLSPTPWIWDIPEKDWRFPLCPPRSHAVEGSP